MAGGTGRVRSGRGRSLRRFTVAQHHYEHDGEVTYTGGQVYLPYGSDTDREYADGLVKHHVLDGPTKIKKKREQG